MNIFFFTWVERVVIARAVGFSSSLGHPVSREYRWHGQRSRSTLRWNDGMVIDCWPAPLPISVRNGTFVTFQTDRLRDSEMLDADHSVAHVLIRSWRSRLHAIRCFARLASFIHAASELEQEFSPSCRGYLYGLPIHMPLTLDSEAASDLERLVNNDPNVQSARMSVKSWRRGTLPAELLGRQQVVRTTRPTLLSQGCWYLKKT